LIKINPLNGEIIEKRERKDYRYKKSIKIGLHEDRNDECIMLVDINNNIEYYPEYFR